MTVDINRLLLETGLQPVLVEIGPREQPPEIWDGIAQSSTYLAAGPDSELSAALLRGRFHQAHVVDELVTPDASEAGSPLHVTRDPVYSSVLEPKPADASSDFLDDQCLLGRATMVRNTTLNALAGRFGLPTIDWLNTNVNGLDFALYQSLNASLRRRLLAVDTVVDLVDFWQQQGSPASAYHRFVDDGFWLSRMSAYGLPRMRPDSVARLRVLDSRLDESFFGERLRRSPGWLFLRFFRSLASMSAGAFSQRDYVVLWAFALLDDQLGYAADVAFEYGRQFGEGSVFQTLVGETLERVRQSEAPMAGLRQTLRRGLARLSK